MKELSFSNREIVKMLDDHTDDLKKYMTDLITPLTTQVTYTNGRLRLLEKMVWTALGGVAVLAYFFSQGSLDLGNKEALVEALEGLEIPVVIDIQNLP